MICQIEKTTDAEYINPLYSLPEMAKLLHDNCIKAFIDHPAVEYQLATINGEPVAVVLQNEIGVFGNSLWNALNPENKVSLYVRFTDIGSGAYEDIIFNQYAAKEEQA